MDQHDGVVVDIDDAALWRHRLGDLVGVVGRGQAGADVEELADARLAGQILDRARTRKAQEAQAFSTIAGKASRIWSATWRSTKVSLPPSQ